MNRREISQNSSERALVLVHLKQDVLSHWRSCYRFPHWRTSIVGYVLCVPLIGLTLLVPLLEFSRVGHSHLLEVPLLLVTIAMAFVWGGGPATFSLGLGFVVQGYFFWSLHERGSVVDWGDLTPHVLYLVAALAMVLMAVWGEVGRRQARLVEQELRIRAEELEQINQQLEQRLHMRDVFFSRASHELKTPLTAIYGQAQLGLRRYARLATNRPDLEPVRASLEKIEEQGSRLQLLLDDLLDVEMLHSGKLKLQFKRCCIDDICKAVVEEQRQLSGRSISLTLPSTPLVLRCDGLRLTQVLVNLVTNALKYSTDDSMILVAITPQQFTIQIQVTNEGPEIPLDQQESIFEPFYRAPDGQRSLKRGWGLGLAICKDLVEHHNGRIWVESALGRTSFFVELPLI